MNAYWKWMHWTFKIGAPFWKRAWELEIWLHCDLKTKYCFFKSVEFPIKMFLLKKVHFNAALWSKGDQIAAMEWCLVFSITYGLQDENDFADSDT